MGACDAVDCSIRRNRGSDIESDAHWTTAGRRSNRCWAWWPGSQALCERYLAWIIRARCARRKHGIAYYRCAVAGRYLYQPRIDRVFTVKRSAGLEFNDVVIKVAGTISTDRAGHEGNRV